ncbi:MAG: hypothetical protein ACPKQO_02730 [Nitrososphaeraceae archaeon]
MNKLDVSKINNLMILLCIVIIIFSFNNHSKLEIQAHKEFQFGNITIEPGWTTEPPLKNEITEIEVIITKNEVPVRNALKDIDVNIKYGGLSKPIKFTPSEKSAGVYYSEIIPTQLGKYSLEFDGKIGDQIIKDVLPIEEVEDTKKISFPIIENENKIQSNEFVANQIKLIINDINNDINDMGNYIIDSEKILKEISNNYKDILKDIDRTNFIIYIILGISISSIILSVSNLKRNQNR